MANPWLQHVAQTRKENPGMSYTDALVAAKKTYTKMTPANNDNNANNKAPKAKKVKSKKAEKKSKKSKKSSKGKRPANPWLNHVAETRKANPGMSYTDALVAAKKTYKK